MLTQTSTPVPLRIAKRVLAGIIIVSSASVASVILHKGLELNYELGVHTAISRAASITAPSRAIAAEAPKKLATAKKEANVKKASYFIKPAKGIDWGIIHANNGVDIANKCGTAIVAAADGIVSDIGAGWNGGYGNAVSIKHPNGVVTFYAHLEDVLVEIGQSVEQGDLIGNIGLTGKSTGCHLHFEVHGGTNPFGK